MKLKYERQWEIVEKIAKENRYDIEIGFFRRGHLDEIKKIKEIIWQVFKLNNFLNQTVLYHVFLYSVNMLYLSDWETQQKPLLDRLIEVCLEGKKNE